MTYMLLRKKTTQHLFEVGLGEVTKGARLGRGASPSGSWGETKPLSQGVNPSVHGVTQEQLSLVPSSSPV